MLFVRTIACAVVLLALSISFAHADKRVALVIGNSAYEFTGQLPNPKNDAADVANALRQVGFQVIDGLNLDKAAFDRKLRDFATALQGADVGLFFYAGHGLQVAEKNYLIPVDAKLDSVAALGFATVRLEDVKQAMESATKTRILFLDACRNNPLARNLARSLGTRSADSLEKSGLAAVAAEFGTLISFSTQPGNVALDGEGRNSPFAGSLVKHIGDADEDLSGLLIAVRNEVIRETNSRQVPWDHSALTERFFFKPPAVAPVAPLEELFRKVGVTHGPLTSDRGSSTITINDISAEPKEPGYPKIRIGRVVLSQPVIGSEQFSARRIEVKDGEVLFDQELKARIDNLTLENVNLAPAAFQLSQLFALADTASATDQTISPGDVLTRLAEGVRGVRIGKLEVHGVKFGGPGNVAAKLSTLSFNKFENGKFSDLELGGLSAGLPEELSASRILLKGIDLGGLLRASARPDSATESQTPGQVGELLRMLEGIEVENFTFSDTRPGQAPGQTARIESITASWGRFINGVPTIGGVPTTIHVTAKGTLPLSSKEDSPLELLREAGQKSYSFSIEFEARWAASSQMLVVSPAIIEISNLLSARALVTIVDIPSDAFISDPASFVAAAAGVEFGLIDFWVRDTGFVGLLVNELAKERNISVEAARKAIIEEVSNHWRQQFVDSFSQFLEAPGATWEIFLTPKDGVTVMKVFESLNSSPDGGLANFDFTKNRVRRSQLVESK